MSQSGQWSPVENRHTVRSADAQSGTWLVRADCQPDQPGDAATVALLSALVAGEQR